MNRVAAALQSSAGVQLALLDPGRQPALQALAVAANHRLHQLLGNRILGALQFAEQQARHARVLHDEIDVRQEHRFQRRQRRGGILGGGVQAPQQMLGQPLHHRLQDRVLAREMPEQRALGQAHAAGNRRRGDVAGILFRRQFDHGIDDHGAPFVGRQVFALRLHENTDKKVINYYLMVQITDVKLAECRAPDLGFAAKVGVNVRHRCGILSIGMPQMPTPFDRATRSIAEYSKGASGSASAHPCCSIHRLKSSFPEPAIGRDAAIGIRRPGRAVHEIAGNLEIQRQGRSWSAWHGTDEAVAGLLGGGDVNAVEVNQIAGKLQRTILLHESVAGNFGGRHRPRHGCDCHRCRQQEAEPMLAARHVAPCAQV